MRRAIVDQRLRENAEQSPPRSKWNQRQHFLSGTAGLSRTERRDFPQERHGRSPGRTPVCAYLCARLYPRKRPQRKAVTGPLTRFGCQRASRVGRFSPPTDTETSVATPKPISDARASIHAYSLIADRGNRIHFNHVLIAGQRPDDESCARRKILGEELLPHAAPSC